MRFQNQTVVVIGAYSIFIHELAKVFAVEGARVFVLGMPSALRDERVPEARYIETSLIDAAQVRVAVKQVLAESGQINVLVTNMMLPMPAEAVRPARDISAELWDEHQRRFYSSVY